MAKEVVNSFIHRDVSAEIVKANNRFSFSISGTHSGRHINHCAYCFGQWEPTQYVAEEAAIKAIDDKIAGTFRPFIGHRPPVKPNGTRPPKKGKVVLHGTKYVVHKKNG